MSRKKGETTLIVPGRETWELWSVTPTGETQQKLVSDVRDVHSLKEMPSGESILFFPLNQLTFAPFFVETADESLYEDLVESHWEQLGIRLSPDDGILSDYVTLEKTENNSFLAPFVLAPQSENDLPLRLPSHFDISPHAYQVNADVLAFHKELGKWAMSFYRSGQIFFATVLGDDLDEEAIRGANMILMQLSLQGCCPKSYKVELWNDEEMAQLPQWLNKPVHARTHPSPVLPRVWSRILPADVHSERRKKAVAQRIKLICALGIIAYAAVLIFHIFGLSNLKSEVAELEAVNKQDKVPYQSLEELKKKWDLLTPALDSAQWSDDLLYRVYNARPDAKSVTFKSFEVKTTDATGYPQEIEIQGTAPTPDDITKFGQRLKSPQYNLDNYKWTLVSQENPTATNKEWSFNYQATLPQPEDSEG